MLHSNYESFFSRFSLEAAIKGMNRRNNKENTLVEKLWEDVLKGGEHAAIPTDLPKVIEGSVSAHIFIDN